MGIFNEDAPGAEFPTGKIDEDEKFITSFRAAGVADATQRNLYVENPSSASGDVFIYVSFNPSALAEAVIAENVAQDGTGTATTVLNANAESGTSPTAITRTQDAYTINGSQVSAPIPGGTISAIGNGGSAVTPAASTFLLSPGTSMLFRVINRSGGQATIGVSAAWYELDL